jgi:hypothetical protein
MICYCPYCSNDLPEKLIEGVIFCSKCNRCILSSRENELLSAFRFMKKNPYYNHSQFKHFTNISNEDLEFVENNLDENLSVEEFQRKVKGCTDTLKVMCSPKVD